MCNELLFSQISNGGTSPVFVQKAFHGSPVLMHSHNFYEIVYVNKGFTVHYYDDTTTVLTEGDLFAVRPGVPHSYTGLHFTEVFNCLFLEEAIDDFRSDFVGLSGLRWLSGETFDGTEWTRIRLGASERMRIVSILERMQDEQEHRGTNWQQMMKLLLAQLLTLFSRFYSERYLSSTADNMYLNFVMRILSYIETHYAEELDLASLAEIVEISPDYLSRQFKKIMGLSPVSFLRSYRLARAMDLIRSSQSDNLSTIASSVGYKYLSHFSREFKNFTGVTPSEYKAKCYHI